MLVIAAHSGMATMHSGINVPPVEGRLAMAVAEGCNVVERMFEEHFEGLYRYLRRSLRADEAEAAAQQVFMELLDGSNTVTNSRHERKNPDPVRLLFRRAQALVEERRGRGVQMETKGFHVASRNHMLAGG
ncbi:MAG: hypothetical protein H7Y88_08395 [Phycisphaerales bacterium]|nr:hypothetical protein [Phycisphaerales bacterium]